MENDIKTFPIRFNKKYHEKLVQAAEEKEMTLTNYLYEAIDEKLKGDENDKR